MRRITVFDRFRYWFDSVMSRGVGSQIGLLSVASLALVLLGALAIVVFGLYPPLAPGEPAPSFAEVFWNSLLRALSSGSLRQDQGWAYRAVMLVITIGGLIIVAALIGVVSAAFDARIRRLQSGRARVLERGHTVILGWSNTLATIVGEVHHAAAGAPTVIVILADRDPVELDRDLRAALPRLGKTKLIVRTGEPMDHDALDRVSLDTARGIIVLSPDGTDDPDSEVIRTVLAIVGMTEPTGTHRIVGELDRPGSLHVAQLIAPSEVTWVLGTDAIAGLTVQSCRQLGLAAVHTALLDFEGHEFSIVAEPSLVGKTFAEARRSYRTSTVVGIARAEGVALNPSAETALAADDKLLVLAATGDAIAVESSPAAQEAQLVFADIEPEGERHTLILGAHAGLSAILSSLESFFPAGSSATVIADIDVTQHIAKHGHFATVIQADSSDRDVLERIDLERFDHVVVLPYKDRMSPRAADARTLVTLLQLRDLRRRAALSVPFVSEMLDDRNRELASVDGAEDFIVSDKIISFMLAQVSRNPQLAQVFHALFAAEGSELCIRPSHLYVSAGEPVSFATVVEAAARRGETALGFRVGSAAHDSSRNFGVTISPAKDSQRSYADGDAVIVLSGV